MRRTFPLAMTALVLGACTATPRPSVIAHRGASWDAPEHTFAAWDLALAQGADWIEQDLQMTRDGVLVVLHDDTLDRTARGPAASCAGSVRERTWAELQDCDAGRWFNGRYPERAQERFAAERIPSLAQVLERYAGRPDTRFYIETKAPESAPGMEEALLDLLRRHRLTGPGADSGRVLVQSFSPASLMRLNALDPTLPLVQLLGEPIPPVALDSALDAVARYAVGIGPSHRGLTEDLVRRAHARRLVVHPYTVNDTAAMRRLLDLGVDGMFTDRPGVLRAMVGAR